MENGLQSPEYDEGDIWSVNTTHIDTQPKACQCKKISGHLDRGMYPLTRIPVSALICRCRDSTQNSGKCLTTSPRKDAIRIRIEPSGKRIANANPMIVPCAVTAVLRSGFTFAQTGLYGFVFLQVSTMLSGRAQEFRDNVSGLPTGLNNGIMGWGSTNPWPTHQYCRRKNLRIEETASGRRRVSIRNIPGPRVRTMAVSFRLIDMASVPVGVVKRNRSFYIGERKRQ